MLSSSNDKPFFLAIRGKVIAAFLLACLAIAMALSITYLSFRGLLTNVDQLSSPNEKLKILNYFFQRVTQLDQQQRADAINNPKKPFNNFLLESKELLSTLDTLRSMDWKDARQVHRLDAMEEIVIERDRLFLSYLRMKSDFIYNKNFSKRLDSLSEVLSDNYIRNDSGIQSTQKKTITTTYLPGDVNATKDNRSFLNRIFSKKKVAKPFETKVEVQEELSVIVDTLVRARQDSVIVEVGQVMKTLEHNQVSRNQRLIQGELELINANTILINQLLSILREVEKEELIRINKSNDEAVQLVNIGIQRIGLIILIFFLGAAALVFLILTDISRSNYFKNQLVKAKEEAEQLGFVKQRFLANMSHEIRTPLQSILGFVEQLKVRHKADEEALSAIRTASEHLLHIVNEVLDYSRIEFGKLTLEHEPFYLTQVIQEVSAGIRLQAEQRGLSFLVDIHAEDMRLAGDAFRLRQVLYNLLGNAVKFTTQGFIKLAVDVEAVDDKVKCTFCIIDTGIGIDSEHIDRIFQQFEQASVSINQQYGGTGLGLTIVKKLVEAQGGQLQVESEPGAGSTFTVTLTFDKIPELPAVMTHSINNRTNNIFTGRVMVVDDDPLILRLCSLILQKNHIDHITFLEPEKALKYTNYDGVELILLDIRMPNINGVELCKAIRKQVKIGTRIVALTAHALPQERANLRKECFDDVLTKPFREQNLLEIIGVTSVLTEEINSRPAPVINLSLIRQMTMNDESLFQSVVIQFIEESNDDIKKLQVFLNTSDGLAAREIVHKLAGRTGQMGMSKLATRFRDVEEALERGEHLSAIIDDLQEAIQELKNLLKEIGKDILTDHER